MVNNAAGTQHLQITAGIWTNNVNPPHSDKKGNVQISTSDGFPFLYMNMIWSPDQELQFGIFRGKGQQLKYVREIRTHTTSTLCAIPSVVLNHLGNLPCANLI